jgi:hypothetical protein
VQAFLLCAVSLCSNHWYQRSLRLKITLPAKRWHGALFADLDAGAFGLVDGIVMTAPQKR